MWAANYWASSFWQKRYWEKKGGSLPPVSVPAKPYWASYWQKGYWQVKYWPGSGLLPPPFNPPIPPAPPAPPPAPFTFETPLVYDWTRSVTRSSFISTVSYNGGNQKMAITYKGGGQDIFTGVGNDLAESLTSAFAPDQFYIAYIAGKLTKQ
jgi:hypothetical protein